MTISRHLCMSPCSSDCILTRRETSLRRTVSEGPVQNTQSSLLIVRTHELSRDDDQEEETTNGWTHTHLIASSECAHSHSFHLLDSSFSYRGILGFPSIWPDFTKAVLLP